MANREEEWATAEVVTVMATVVVTMEMVDCGVVVKVEAVKVEAVKGAAAATEAVAMGMAVMEEAVMEAAAMAFPPYASSRVSPKMSMCLQLQSRS